jgi:ABC-2 type transport system ATP-binding protein
MTMIEINNLSKSYGGIKAVNNISFSINKGEMFGLVGPDGAGKTTTIRVLCGLLNADAGNIRLLEKDLLKHRKYIQNNIGYLSQKFSLYGDLTVDENIEFFADIHNVKNYEPRRDELLEFTRLKPFRTRLADRLSGGMKQKLALACALIHKPTILFLDEPTTGVDPISRRDFWKILASLLKEGMTIFLTTPYLDEAERCNRVALMNDGKIMILDTPQKIKESIGRLILEIVCSDVRGANNIIKENTSFDVYLYGDRIDVTIKNNADAENIVNLLKQNNIEVIDTRTMLPSLENVLMYMINAMINIF